MVLTFSVPANPGDAVATIVVMEPLSVGAALGVTVALVPTTGTSVAGYVPRTGALFAVTLTVTSAVDFKPAPSVASIVTG